MYYLVSISGDFKLQARMLVQDATNNFNIDIGLISDTENLTESPYLLIRTNYYCGNFFVSVTGRCDDGTIFSSQDCGPCQCHGGLVSIGTGVWYSYEFIKSGSGWQLAVYDEARALVGSISGDLPGNISDLNNLYIGNWNARDWPTANGKLDDIPLLSVESGYDDGGNGGEVPSTGSKTFIIWAGDAQSINLPGVRVSVDGDYIGDTDEKGEVRSNLAFGIHTVTVQADCGEVTRDFDFKESIDGVALTIDACSAESSTAQDGCGRILSYSISSGSYSPGQLIIADMGYKSEYDGELTFKGVLLVKAPDGKIYSGSKEKRTPALQENGYGANRGNSIEVRIHEDAPSGEYSVKLELCGADDRLCDSEGWIENQFQIEPRPAVEGDVKAEIIDPIYWPEGSHKPWDMVDVQYTIKNTGTENHKFYLGASVRGPDGNWIDLPYRETRDLAPDEEILDLLRWTVPEDAVVGSYDITIAVWKDKTTDGEELVDELDRETRENLFQIEPILSASEETSSVQDKCKSLTDQGKYEDAIICYDEIIALNRSDANTLFKKGISLFYLGRQDEALQALNNSTDIDPKNAKTWHAKGAVLNELGRIAEFLSAEERAIQLDPNVAIFWYGKSIALESLGKRNESTQAFEKALNIDRNGIIDTLQGNGIAMIYTGNYAGALDMYTQLLSLDPKSDKGWANKGVVLSNLGRFLDANEAFDKAIEINPDLAIAWYDKGSVLNSLGRATESDAAFAKAKELEYPPT
jgi:tetratricopeptide (TPR) repeat protein